MIFNCNSEQVLNNNHYVRQLVVSWISVLDSVPDLNLLEHLPEFLGGLFLMLSDSQKGNVSLRDCVAHGRVSKSDDSFFYWLHSHAFLFFDIVFVFVPLIS